MGGVIGIAEVTGVEDVDIALVDDLDDGRGTLLSGLVKKRSQFSAWSNISGKKMRVGLSGVVAWMWRPLNLTLLESTRLESRWEGWYCLGCG